MEEVKGHPEPREQQGQTLRSQGAAKRFRVAKGRVVGGRAGACGGTSPSEPLAVSFLRTGNDDTNPGREIPQNQCVESVGKQSDNPVETGRPSGMPFSIVVAP